MNHVRGGAHYPPSHSAVEMCASAVESPQIRRTKEWHDDRRAERALHQGQGPQRRVPHSALVPSRIKCEVCGIYIEAEYAGSTYQPKSIYFYPVRDEIIKMVTQRCHVRNQIVILCEECAIQKSTPIQRAEHEKAQGKLAPGYRRKGWTAPRRERKPLVGLPAEYAIVKPEDWALFPSHMDLKNWLWWQRFLGELLLFGPRSMLQVAGQWLDSQIAHEEQVLAPFGESITGVRSDPLLTQSIFPLRYDASCPVAPAVQRLCQEQARLFH